MSFPFARLFGRLLRVDPSATAAPWPVQLWNMDTRAWDNIAMEGSGFARTYLWDDAGTLLVDAHGDLVTVL